MPDQTNLLEEIDIYLNKIKEIPGEKDYWMIRTQSGQFYESFRKYGFIAIEHENIGLYEISKLMDVYKEDKKGLYRELKSLAAKKYPEEKRPGLIASQIIKFVNEIKRDDIIIIPSESSEIISIGIVTSSKMQEVTSGDIDKTGCPYRKRKSVKWIKDLSRDSLDPYLYRVLQAHQAINNINAYGDYIERSISNFYIKGNEANLILQVEQNDDINARKLFGLGYYLLDYAQEFFDKNDLGLSVDEIEVKINLNSKGKIQFKAPNARTLWLIAVLTVAVNGGGLKINVEGFNLDLSTHGIIQKVIDYQNNSHDRAIVDTLINNMDSLKVKSPDDAVKMLQQFSTNKNNPK